MQYVGATFEKVVIKTFFKEVTFELSLEWWEWAGLGLDPAEETASAKVLRWEQVWSVLGTARRLVWLELSEASWYSWRDTQEPDLANHGEGFEFCFKCQDLLLAIWKTGLLWLRGKD